MTSDRAVDGEKPFFVWVNFTHPAVILQSLSQRVEQTANAATALVGPPRARYTRAMLVIPRAVRLD